MIPRRSHSFQHRGIAILAALGIALSSLIASVAPAQAAASAGVITSTGPLTQIRSNGVANTQLVNASLSSFGLTCCGTTSASANSILYLHEGTSTTAATLTAGAQSFGGDGTAGSPYYIESKPTTSIPNVQLAHRLTYLPGDTFVRDDVTLTNTRPDPVTITATRFIDCYIGGNTSTYGGVSSGSVSCFKGQAVAKIQPLTSGADVMTGFAAKVKEAASTRAALSGRCVNSLGGSISDTLCRTTLVDGSMALGWRDVTIPAGGTLVLSHSVAYAASTTGTAELTSTVTSTSAKVLQGDQFSVTFAVTNSGPDIATGVAALVTNPGPRATIASVTADGSYDQQARLWQLGTIGVGETKRLTITYTAASDGNTSFQFQGISSDSVDPTVCSGGSTCGSAPVEVRTPYNLSSKFSVVSTGTRVADGVDAHELRVYLRDGYTGAPVTGRPDQISAVSGATVGAWTEGTDANGPYYSAPLTSTVAGTKSIKVTILHGALPGGDVPLLSGGTATAQFVPGPAASLSTVTIDDANERLADGSEVHVVTVTLRDAFGNVIAPDPQLFTIDAPAGVSASWNATTSTASAWVSSTVAGVQPVQVVYDGVPVSTPVDARFRSGPMSPVKSQLTALTTGSKEVSDPLTVDPGSTTNIHQVQARVVDQYDNPIVGVDVTFTLTGGLGTVGGTSTTVTTDAMGVARLSVTSTQASSALVTHRVAATVGGTTVSGSPLTVEFHPLAAPDMAQSRLLATAGMVAADGVAAHRVEAQARDRFGNAIPGIATVFDIGSLTAVGGTSATSTTDSLGNTEVNIASTTAGAFQVTATLDGVPVTLGSPAALEYGAGAPVVAQSTVTVSPAGPITAGSAYTATVTLRDQFANPVPGEAVAFSLDAGLSAQGAGPYVSGADGTISVPFTATTAGTYSLIAQLGVETIGATQSLVFIAGPPDASHPLTSLTITSDSVDKIANGSEMHTVTAFVADQYGNPVAGADVEFALPPGVTVAGGGSAIATTTSGGRADLDVVSTVAALYQITASAGGTSISNGSPVTIRFVPGAVSTTLSDFTVTEGGPLVVGTGPANTYHGLVKVVDTFGNPIRDQQVLLSTNPTITQTLQGGFTDVNGELAVGFTSTVPGVFQITGELGRNGRILPATVTREYIAGNPDVAATGKSRLTVSPGAKLADGIDMHTLTAVLLDEFGNPVTGRTVAFELPPDIVVAGGGAATAVTDATGTASLTVTSETPGNYPVSARLDSGAGALIQNGAGSLVEFAAGLPDPSVSVLTVTSADPAPLTVGTGASSTYTVTATVTDGAGNPIAGVGVDFALTLPGGGALGTQPALSAPSASTDAAGLASVTVTSTRAGSFAAQAAVAGTQISGSPGALEWVAGPANPITSVLSVTGGYRLAGGPIQHAATLTALDQYGNLVTDPVDFDLAVASPASGSGTVTTINSSATQPITSLQAGVFSVVATLGGTPIAGSPAVAQFAAPPPPPTINPGTSSITGTGIPDFTITVTWPDGSSSVAVVDPSGNWNVAPPGTLVDGQVVSATQTNPETGFTSDAATMVVDQTAPSPPILDPSNGRLITGRTVEPGATVTVTDPSGAQIPGTLAVNPDGSFSFAPETPLAHGTQVLVTFTDPSGNAASSSVIVDAEAAPLQPQPSDGSRLVGRGEPGAGIQVTNAAGTVIGRGTVAADGSFSIAVSPAPREGEIVTLTMTDTLGNQATLPLRIGLPRIELQHDLRKPGEQQTATGVNFQPGERVSGVMQSTPIDLGTQVADAEGRVTFTVTVPESMEPGTHRIELTGLGISGVVSAIFTVIEAQPAPLISLPRTGAAVWTFLLVGAALSIGGGLLIVARRSTSR